MQFSFLPKRTLFFALSAIFVTLLTVACMHSIASQAHAQESTAYSYQPETAVSDTQVQGILLMRAFFFESLNTLTCHMIGVQRESASQDCLVTDSSTGHLRPLSKAEIVQQDRQPGGVLVFATGAIEGLYTPPANFNRYTTSLANNFGIAKTTHAQSESPTPPPASEFGSGYSGLNQIFSVWTLSRNIVYLLLVIAFVVIGMAIMLRVHIDPRTVMTIQNQIPKAIIAILVITFSYAIAGLLIDFMWAGTYFGINAITSTRDSCSQDINFDYNEELPVGAAATVGILNNPLGYATDIFGDATGCFGAFDGLSGLAATIGRTFADAITRSFIALLGGEEDLGSCMPGGDFDTTACVKKILFETVKFIVSIFAFAFVIISLIIALLRLWIRLLKAYIFLLIDIVFAPFWILTSILPGSSLTFNLWVRNLVAQLAVFPSAAILLVMASIVASDPNINDPKGGVFLPPLIGNPNIADNLGALIAFGFILLTPELMDMIREALKSPASKWSGAVGQGAGRGNPIAAIGAMGTVGYQLGGAKNIPLINKLPGLKQASHTEPPPGAGGPGH